MPFPESQKVIYEHNPLDKVICQLRFPPILTIDTKVPAEFQESIRNDFPGFREKEQIVLPIPKMVKGNVPEEVFKQMISSETKNYEFSSEDKIWTINLTRTFMALSTKEYLRWDDFRNHLQIPLQPFINIYKPASFSRVGLRYIDIIKRSVLNLENVPWRELLQPHVLGLLSSIDVNENIRSIDTSCVIQLDDEISMARIVMGLVDKQELNEECFMIDTDFYTTQKTDIPDVISRLDYFHIRGARLFRWLITDRLHEAMEPEEIT